MRCLAGGMLVVWSRHACGLAGLALGVFGAGALAAGLWVGAVGAGCLLSRLARNCGPVHGHDAVFNAGVFSAECAARLFAGVGGVQSAGYADRGFASDWIDGTVAAVCIFVAVVFRGRGCSFVWRVVV